MDAQLSLPTGYFGRSYLVQQGRKKGFGVQSGTTFYKTKSQNEDQTVLNYELSIVTNDEKIRALRK